MKLVFAGTPDFAVPALDALQAAGHQLLAVFTQPDRPAGRGRKSSPSPVASRAAALGIPIHRPARLDADAQTQLRLLSPDAMVVVAYGLILPQAVLDIPRFGCLNIHASLLPRWRGAAPIARAVEAGDRETGITIMRMDAGLDTGPMLLRAPLPITETTTAATLQALLAPLGAQLIAEALGQLGTGQLAEQAQAADGATYAKKLSKEEARIDWSQPAAMLARRVRAFNPAPVAWSALDTIEGERIRFWNAAAHPLTVTAEPGTVVSGSADALSVVTLDGVLAITELQRPGGRVLDARDALRNGNLVGRRFV